MNPQGGEDVHNELIIQDILKLIRNDTMQTEDI